MDAIAFLLGLLFLILFVVMVTIKAWFVNKRYEEEQRALASAKEQL